MKTKALLTFFALLVISGMILVIRFGIQPRPIPKIKLSTFESPSQMARSFLLNLHEEIRQSPILLLGYQPEHPEQLAVVMEFLKSNREPELVYDTVIADSRLELPAEVAVTERIETRERIEDLAAGLQRALAEKRRTVVLLPSVYSSHLVEASVQRILSEKLQLPIMSLTLGELLRSRDQEKSMTLPCVVSEVDNTGTGGLGCAIVQTSRLHYRKKMTAGRHTGLLEQRGSQDYLLLYSSVLENEIRKD